MKCEKWTCFVIMECKVSFWLFNFCFVLCIVPLHYYFIIVLLSFFFSIMLFHVTILLLHLRIGGGLLLLHHIVVHLWLFPCVVISVWLILRVIVGLCHNLSLGLMTKVRAYKGAGQEWSPGVTFHVIGSVGECEGMNPYTPKWTPTLGIGVLMDS